MVAASLAASEKLLANHQRNSWKTLRSSFYHKPIPQTVGCFFNKFSPLAAAAVVSSDLPVQPPVSSSDSPRGHPAACSGSDNSNEQTQSDQAKPASPMLRGWGQIETFPGAAKVEEAYWWGP